MPQGFCLCIFFAQTEHVAADDISSAATFLQKVTSHSFCRSSFPNRTRFAGFAVGWGRGSESLRLECRAEAVNKRKKVLDLTSVLSPVPFFVRQKLAYGTLSRSPAGLGSSPTSIFAGLRPGKSFECGYTRIACPNVRPHKFLPLSKVSYENPL